MKKLTVGVFLAMLTVVCVSGNPYAQKRIKLNKHGKARISARIKPKSNLVYSISGRAFKNLRIQQTKGWNLNYETRRGKKIIASGHTKDSNIAIASDGSSYYNIAIINRDGKPRSFSIVFQDGED